MDTTRSLPSGTVTFLFTDIEGSTKRWEQHPEGMRAALARHDTLLRHAIQAHDGSVFKTVGDAFCAVFATAPNALAAALAAQRALQAEPWDEVGPLRARMALHSGAAEERDRDYFLGTSRLLTLTGSGGCGKTRLAIQVAEAIADDHVDGVWFVDLTHHFDPLLVPQGVASVLGVREQPDRPLLETLAGFLHSKQLLLVLDNCEHLLSACAALGEAAAAAAWEAGQAMTPEQVIAEALQAADERGTLRD